MPERSKSLALANKNQFHTTPAIKKLIETLASPPLLPYERVAKHDNRILTIIPSGPRAVNHFISIGHSSGIQILAKDVITGGEGYVIIHLKKILKLSYLTWQLFLNDEKIRPKALAEVCEKWWQTGSFSLYLVHRDDTVVWDYILRPNAPALPWHSASPKREKKSYRELTIDRYAMPNPFPVEHSEIVWKSYLQIRLRLDYQQLKRRSLWFEYHEKPSFTLIRNSVSWSFNKETVPTEIVEKYCDNVVMIKFNDQKMPGCARKLTVFTRVYLPNSLSFYEVAYYEHIQEMCKVTEDCYGVAFGYRLVTDPTEGCDFRYIERLWSRGVPQMFHRELNGWHNVFYARQNKIENDEHEEWGFDIDSSDIEDLVEAFGLQPAVVMRYLFAAVGGFPEIDENGEKSYVTNSSLWRLNSETLKKEGVEFQTILGDKVQSWCRSVECDKSTLYGPKERNMEEYASVEPDSVDHWGTSGHGFAPSKTWKKSRWNQSHTASKGGNISHKRQPRTNNSNQNMPFPTENSWQKPKKHSRRRTQATETVSAW
ncbi:hypothetical protein BZA77DRAFT_171067 [Pyronema omphalodes]|nr:hypothetical protein BZA77DRAFT_171067 [Pyronema omphalodes]